MNVDLIQQDYIPEGSNVIHSRRRENVKSNKFEKVYLPLSIISFMDL
jgi:hypothetical protein